MSFAVLLIASALLASGPGGDQRLTPSGMDFTAASEAFNRGEYEKAARAFDELYARQKSPPLLHYAALAWATARDDTRAILRWRRLVADPQATAYPEVKEARGFLSEAYKRTTAVSVAVTPARALGEGSRLQLERLDVAYEAVVIEPEGIAEGGRWQVDLAPGRWRVTASTDHPGYAAASVELEAIASQPNLEVAVELQPRQGELAVTVVGIAQATSPILVLEDVSGVEGPLHLPLPLAGAVPLRAGIWRYSVARRPGEGSLSGEVDVHAGERAVLSIALGTGAPAPDPNPPEVDQPPRRHPKLSLGLGLGSLALGGVGLGLFAASYQTLGPRGLRREGDDCTPADYHTLGEDETRRLECVVAPALERSNAGAVFMGSSLGLATTAVLARVGIRRRAYWIPWSVGLATFVGGLAGQQVAQSRLLVWFIDAERGNDLSAEEAARIDLTVPQSEIDRLHWRGEVPGGVFLGYGAGLFVGASLALLVEHLEPRVAKRVRNLSLSPSARGARLQIRF